jgi:hypothetical protein
MTAICLFVASVVRATIPTSEFTLAWDHSVEKTRWEERYRVADNMLTLVDARVQGNGAGMEPPPGSTLRDGAWTWHPRTILAELRLTHSSFTADYVLCTPERCAPLGDWVGATAEGERVDVRPCGGDVSASAGRQQVGR